MSCEIEVDGLIKRFGTNTVLNGIDLCLKPGERVAIIGPSGTGKSTLLRCLNWLDRPDEGRIVIGDLQVDAAKAGKSQILALRRRTGFVFQNYALFANKTARENIMEGLTTVRGWPKDKALARADKILSQIGLGDRGDSYPSGMSGGQQQRVGIGRAMALDADLMLFDEPTIALDPELVGEVLNVMKTLAAEGMTMAVVTHEMGFAAHVADQVGFMEAGELVAVDSPDVVLRAPSDPRILAFLRTYHERNAF